MLRVRAVIMLTSGIHTGKVSTGLASLQQHACALPAQAYQDFNAQLMSFAASHPMLHYLVCGWTTTGPTALLYRCVCVPI